MSQAPKPTKSTAEERAWQRAIADAVRKSARNDRENAAVLKSWYRPGARSRK